MVHFQKKIIVFFFFGTFPNRHLKLSLVIFGLVVISRMCFAAGNAKTRLDGPPRQPQQQRVQVEGFQQNGIKIIKMAPGCQMHLLSGWRGAPSRPPFHRLQGWFSVLLLNFYQNACLCPFVNVIVIIFC